MQARPRRNIIWLASYPKSGNTWVRAFLANYFSKSSESVSLNAIKDFTLSDVRQGLFDMAVGRSYRAGSPVEAIRMRPRVQTLISTLKPGQQFVKTHSTIKSVQGVPLISPKVTSAAICIVRNPFDVALSFSRHYNMSVDDSITAMATENYMIGSASGIAEVLDRWDSNIGAWITAPGLTRILIRYEDLLVRPQIEFRKMLKFLKTPIDRAALTKALAATRFDALRKQEDEGGFIERPPHMEKFFTTGRSGNWREHLSAEQITRVRREFRSMISKLYGEKYD